MSEPYPSWIHLEEFLPQCSISPTLLLMFEARPRRHRHPSHCWRYLSWSGMEFEVAGLEAEYPGSPSWSGRLARNLSNSLLKYWVSTCLMFLMWTGRQFKLVFMSSKLSSERGRDKSNRRNFGDKILVVLTTRPEKTWQIVTKNILTLRYLTMLLDAGRCDL